MCVCMRLIPVYVLCFYILLRSMLPHPPFGDGQVDRSPYYNVKTSTNNLFQEASRALTAGERYSRERRASSGDERQFDIKKNLAGSLYSH